MKKNLLEDEHKVKTISIFEEPLLSYYVPYNIGNCDVPGSFLRVYASQLVNAAVGDNFSKFGYISDSVSVSEFVQVVYKLPNMIGLYHKRTEVNDYTKDMVDEKVEFISLEFCSFEKSTS